MGQKYLSLLKAKILSQNSSKQEEDHFLQKLHWSKPIQSYQLVYRMIHDGNKTTTLQNIPFLVLILLVLNATYLYLHASGYCVKSIFTWHTGQGKAFIWIPIRITKSVWYEKFRASKFTFKVNSRFHRSTEWREYIANEVDNTIGNFLYRLKAFYVSIPNSVQIKLLTWIKNNFSSSEGYNYHQALSLHI